VAVVAPGTLAVIAPPPATLLAVMVTATAAMLIKVRADRGEMPEQENPAELKSALIFAALYALVIFATAVAKDYFGNQALYSIAVISGFVDVDAITLSTARLATDQRLEAGVAWKVILVAALSNLAFKAGVVLALGSGGLFLRLSPLFGVASAAGAAILVFWP
jgi:uncharacterized membrane protein (DUF4010 family)